MKMANNIKDIYIYTLKGRARRDSSGQIFKCNISMKEDIMGRPYVSVKDKYRTANIYLWDSSLWHRLSKREKL